MKMKAIGSAYDYNHAVNFAVIAIIVNIVNSFFLTKIIHNNQMEKRPLARVTSYATD